MKRFWKQAEVIAEDGGWGIALDGRPVRTPERAPLAVASKALAEAIAAEWDAQGEDIDPASMPLTGLANAAIDLASPDPAAFAEPIAAYAESDLFCYRDDRDAALQAEQAAAWNPLLAWAEARHGIEFALTQGVLPVDQPPATIAALRAALLAPPRRCGTRSASTSCIRNAAGAPTAKRRKRVRGARPTGTMRRGF